MLLDTNATLYLGEGKPMRADAVAAIDAAASSATLLISPVTGWEIGLLVRKRRMSLSLEPLLWFRTFLSRSGARPTPLTAEAAITSSFLPEPFHGDPADRMLVATARELGAALVTRDARILAYAEAGHLQAMAC